MGLFCGPDPALAFAATVFVCRTLGIGFRPLAPTLGSAVLAGLLLMSVAALPGCGRVLCCLRTSSSVASRTPT